MSKVGPSCDKFTGGVCTGLCCLKKCIHFICDFIYIPKLFQYLYFLYNLIKLFVLIYF